MRSIILACLVLALVSPAFAGSIDVSEGTSVSALTASGNTYVTDGSVVSYGEATGVNALESNYKFVEDKGGKHAEVFYQQEGGNSKFNFAFYPAEGKISYIPKQVGIGMDIDSDGADWILAGASAWNKANADKAQVQIAVSGHEGDSNAYADGYMGADATAVSASAYAKVLVGGVLPDASYYPFATFVSAKGKKTAAETEYRDTYNDELGEDQYADVYLDMGARSANSRTDMINTKTVATWFVDGDWAQAYYVNENTDWAPIIEHHDGGDFGDGLNSIQDAIDLASAGDTVQVLEGQYLENLYVDKDLTIKGERGLESGDRLVNIDASVVEQQPTLGPVSVSTVEVSEGVTATLDTLQITGGSGVDIWGYGYTCGGGILNYGTLTVNDCEISDNTAVYGAGIYNSGALTMDDSQIDGNEAYDGGALYNGVGASAIITNSQINDNMASYGAGGGISNAYDAKLNVENTALFNNYAGEIGGALFNDGTATFTNCYFGDTYEGPGNGAYMGGAIYQCDGTVTLNNCVLADNYAAAYGGAIFIDYDGEIPTTVNMDGTTIVGNEAELGGGIFSYGHLNADNSFIVANYASGYGGGIYSDYGYMDLTNTQVFGNSPDDIYEE